MNIETFNQTYAHLKDVDLVPVDALCDHTDHQTIGKMIKKVSAKRNILKRGGKHMICRECDVRESNYANRKGHGKQLDMEIVVICPDTAHQGIRERTMKLACYHGEMKEPYTQLCSSCVQRGKVISEEQKKAISETLTGRELTDAHKANISEYMKNSPEGIERAKQNLIPGIGGVLRAGMPLPDDWKKSISDGTKGKPKSLQHRINISAGRKKMLQEQGGFSEETRRKISKSVVKRYKAGFDPRTHHISGYHDSPKAGKIFFRSSYEKKAYMMLDEDASVKTYRPEPTSVEYYHPEKEAICLYVIDLEVEYVNDIKKFVEIKPRKWLKNKVVKAKMRAAKDKAQKAGVPFEIWTEKKIYGTDDYAIIAQFGDWLRAQIVAKPEKGLKKVYVPAYVVKDILDGNQNVIDHELFQHSSSEAALWMLIEHPGEEKPLNIGVMYLEKMPDGKWMSDLHFEEEGIFDYSCPKRILDKASKKKCSSYNPSWRKDCKRYHDSQSSSS